MSTVQKIFVVVIFGLSLIFTFLSLSMLATEQHWKDKCVEIEEKLGKEKKELKARIDDLESERSQLSTKLNESDTKVNVLSQENEKVDSLNKQLDQDLQQARQNEMTLGEYNKVLQTQNEDYKTKLEEMTGKYRKESKRAEDLVKIYQFKQDELADVIAELNDLKASYKTLEVNFKKSEEEAQSLRVVFQEIENTIGTSVSELLSHPVQPPVPIEGKVVAVAKDKESGNVKLVMLSVGKDEDVKKGYQFVISRGETYIAKVVVDRVFDDMATAAVIPESIARDKDGKNVEIKQFDNASTRIY